MGHMTSALISHSCTWWNKAALLSLTLVGSLACFHNRGGNTITTCMKEIVFSHRQHSPSKTWQWQRAPPLQRGSGVSRCVWVRSPQLKKICKKKKNPCTEEGREQQRQTQMGVGSSLCSAWSSEGKEKNGAPRSGEGLLRCVRDWDSGKLRKLWNLDEETKALCLQIFCFFLRVQMLRYARLCKSNRYFTAGQLLGEASGSKQHINSTDGPIMKVLCSPYCSCAVALAPFNGQLPGVNVCNCESQLRN